MHTFSTVRVSRREWTLRLGRPRDALRTPSGY